MQLSEVILGFSILPKPRTLRHVESTSTAASDCKYKVLPDGDRKERFRNWEESCTREEPHFYCYWRCCCCASLRVSPSLTHTLSCNPTSQGRGSLQPPRAWLCLRFLPVKKDFFLAAVAKCCSCDNAGSLKQNETGIIYPYFFSVIPSSSPKCNILRWK